MAAERDIVLCTEYRYPDRSWSQSIGKLVYNDPLSSAAKTMPLQEKKIGPPPLGIRPRQYGWKNCALSESAFRFAIWGGRILFACGAIVIPGKFRGVPPRRAAPRSMRGDAAMPYHDMSIRCHAMPRHWRPGASGTAILKYNLITTKYCTKRNI